MTYSEPTPEQETAGQDAAEAETTGQETSASEQSDEPGKNQGDPLFAETEDDQPDAGAGTATSADA
jgi:hypothetical protein